MKISIIKSGQNKRRGVRLWAVAFWLAVWQLGAMALKQEILLVSPVSVFLTWVRDVQEADFWKRVAFSSVRILEGLGGGMVLGVVMGTLASRFHVIGDILQPVVSVVRAIPVASFIILAVIWFGPNSLSAFIAFLITFPVFYVNMLTGLGRVDPKLNEMAQIFRLSFLKRVRYIRLPAVLPYMKAAVDVSVGLAWKSGIAAEVIAIPRGSIGDKLYGAKIYLETAELFSWTLTVVLLSLLFEMFLRLVLGVIKQLAERG